MSLQTWKCEFYPEDAGRVSKDRALDHSILKWTGLLKKNLAGHEIEQDDQEVGNRSDWFQIDMSTCALCQWYCDDTDDDDESQHDHQCRKCPLAIARGGIPCDTRNQELGEKTSPYATWCELGDARPMLKWLKRAKKEF